MTASVPGFAGDGNAAGEAAGGEGGEKFSDVCEKQIDDPCCPFADPIKDHRDHINHGRKCVKQYRKCFGQSLAQQFPQFLSMQEEAVLLRSKVAVRLLSLNQAKVESKRQANRG